MNIETLSFPLCLQDLTPDYNTLFGGIIFRKDTQNLKSTAVERFDFGMQKGTADSLKSVDLPTYKSMKFFSI